MPAHLRPVALDDDPGSACHGATQDVSIRVNGGVVVAERQVDAGCRRFALRLRLPASSSWLLPGACAAAGRRAAASYRERSDASDDAQVLHGASVVPWVLHLNLVSARPGRARVPVLGDVNKPRS